MGFKQKLKMLTSNHSETSDNHWDEQLKSHYYKANTKKSIEAVSAMIQGMDGFEITSISEERGELSISSTKGKKVFIVVTIISIRPFETSIDFSVSTDTAVLPTDFGYSKKLILTMYSKLDKSLTFIGTGERK